MNKAILIEISIWTAILAVIFSACFFVYSKFFVEPNVYNIEFKDIDGITKGSPVRFMGYNVGYVRALSPGDRCINVQIIVTKKNMKIPNGTVARVEFYGLGGSKSIELMPPDGGCDVGILTNKTIRLHDVVHKTKGLVSMIQLIEKYVRNINDEDWQEALQDIARIKDEKLKKAQTDFKKIEINFSNKVEEIVEDQREVNKKINDFNRVVEKINKFIKR